MTGSDFSILSTAGGHLKITKFCHLCTFQKLFVTTTLSLKKKLLHGPLCAGNDGSPYLGKAQQPQEQHYPVLSVRVVFLFVQTMVRLPVFGMFNVHTDVDACDFTLGLYLHTCLRTKRTGLGVLTHLFEYQED